MGSVAVSAVGARLRGWLRGVPATWTLLLLTVLGPLLPAVGPVRAETLLWAPHTLLTSMLWAPHAGWWPLSVAGVLLLGPPAERAAGTGRFAARVLLGQAVSVLAVLLLARLTSVVDPAWGAVLAGDAVHGP